MISFNLESGRVNIVENVSELPTHSAQEMFMDFETTSFDPKVKAFFPYQGCKIAGVAIVFDDSSDAYYVPVRHHRFTKYNIPEKDFQEWLHSLMRVPRWINHDVGRFDAHFLHHENVEYPGELVCTTTLSKIHDSDRFDHSLKQLCRDWLGLEMSEELEIKSWLDGEKTKDYGELPADLCGKYAVMDVLGNRKLFRFLQRERPDQVKGIWKTELALTPVLFDMSQDGLLVDKHELKIETIRSLQKLITMCEDLEELSGQPYTDSNKNLFDMLIIQAGLPILAWGKEKDGSTSNRASFNKESLELYRVHPSVTCDEKLIRIVEMIAAHRKEAHFKSNYLDAMLRLADDKSRLHPSYNQIVRTGRMSSSSPNSQGMSPRAKDLIHTEDGEAFISADACQVEFRMIVHYIRDIDAIQAYKDDPDTDFHTWMKNLCEIERKPAKNINFAVGFGAGKARVVKMLRTDPSIMRDVGATVNALVESDKIRPEDRPQVYEDLCTQKATEIYYRYHQRLPGIKRTSKLAMERCQTRGFVFNAYGRRRHIPSKAAFKAFNSVIQGCAMDLIKEAIVKLSPRYCEETRKRNIRIAANVHDEILLIGPVDEISDPVFQKFLLDVLETPSKEFSVPFRWNMGISDRTWKEAAKPGKARYFEERQVAGKIDCGALRDSK